MICDRCGSEDVKDMDSKVIEDGKTKGVYKCKDYGCLFSVERWTPVIFAKKKHTVTEVVQIDNNCIVNRFKNIKQASDETGISRSSINACINGRTKQAGGYNWQRVLW